MKTIASQYYYFGVGNVSLDGFTIKLVTNTKDKNSGIYTIIDCNGEHEVGVWERVKEYDYKKEMCKNTFIYRACSFVEMENGKKLTSQRYYKLSDVLKNQVVKFVNETEKSNS